MLATLPSELLDQIISQIASRRDLKQLCEVCTRLHHITVPHLYQSLVLYAPELSLEGLTTALKTISSKHLKYTREFGFRVPIHERVENRCVHHSVNEHFNDEAFQDGSTEALMDDDIFDVMDTNESTDKPLVTDPLGDLSCALDSLRFPDDQLRSFRWGVGTCIPEALFRGNDSLLSNQRCVQSVTLITDGECGSTKRPQNRVDLVQFKELRSLDWRGLHRYTDFQSVEKCIRSYGHQIQSLTLDLLTWLRAEKIWSDGFFQQNPEIRATPDNFFSQRVLNVQPHDKKILFSSLKHLHLSAVSFEHTGMEMAYAFNVGQLKSLKLRNCPGGLNWLRVILKTPMKLRSFEFALDLNSLQRDAYLHITETVCNFLQHVPDLESLYLALPEPINWIALTDRLTDHHRLKRIVIHHLVDRGGQSLIDGDIPWPFPLECILQEKQLSCFGSSIPLDVLIGHLQLMQPKPPCKMLHIRTSGVVLDRLIGGQPDWFSLSHYTYKYGDDLPHNAEIHDFARWAFGADGLPSLQVLAWGDFSYEGRYSRSNLLLCRSESGYKALSPSDVFPWNLVQDNMDMLAACPLDDILE